MLTFKQYLLLTESGHKECKTKIPVQILHFSDNLLESEDALDSYSGKSFGLNASLLALHHLGMSIPETINPKLNLKKWTSHNIPELDEAVNKPLGEERIVYSGSGFDPRQEIIQKGKNKGLLHLPAYTSTSLSKEIAKNYIRSNHYAIGQESGLDHMFRIHLRATDNGAMISNSAEELVLPRNTTLRIHKSEMDPDGKNLMIHYATIEHGIDPEEIERNPEKLKELPERFHVVYKNTDIFSGLHSHYSKEFDKKLNLGEFTKKDLDDGYFHGYYDKNKHYELLGEHKGYMDDKERKSAEFSDNIGKGFHISNLIDDALFYNYFNKKKHVPLLKEHLAKVIKSGGYYGRDLIDGDQYGFYDAAIHNPLLSTELSEKMENGEFDEGTMSLAQQFGYLNNVHRKMINKWIKNKHNAGNLSLGDVQTAHYCGALDKNDIIGLRDWFSDRLRSKKIGKIDFNWSKGVGIYVPEMHEKYVNLEED
jgi:hypothetical protein